MTTDPQAHWNKTYQSRAMVGALEFTKQAAALLHEKFAKSAADLLHTRPNVSILDIGCGDGRDAHFFAEQGLIVTAIDFSSEAIERVKKLNSAIDARVMETQRMNFPDASFDAIYAHLSLHYFDDVTTTAVFRNVYRMLKPGGFFFVKCKSTKDTYYGEGERVGEHMYVRSYLRHFFTPEYMRKQLNDFTVLTLDETAAEYDGKTSAFIEAVAIKP